MVKDNDENDQSVEQHCDHVHKCQEDEINTDEGKSLKTNDVETWRVNDDRVVQNGPENSHS